MRILGFGIPLARVVPYEMHVEMLTTCREEIMTVTLYPLTSHGIKLYLPEPLYRSLVVQSPLAEREGKKRAMWKVVLHYVWEFLMLNKCEK